MSMFYKIYEDKECWIEVDDILGKNGSVSISTPSSSMKCRLFGRETMMAFLKAFRPDMVYTDENGNLQVDDSKY